MRYTEPLERALFMITRTWLQLDLARILDIEQIAYAHLNGMEFGFDIEGSTNTSQIVL